MTSFFFNDTATTEIYTLSLHDALPISIQPQLLLQRRRVRFSLAGDERVGAQQVERQRIAPPERDVGGGVVVHHEIVGPGAARGRLRSRDVEPQAPPRIGVVVGEIEAGSEERGMAAVARRILRLEDQIALLVADALEPRGAL